MTGEARFQATRDSLPQRFQISQNQEISYRVVGGTATILEKLCEGFSGDELVLNQKVTGISEDETSIKVLTAKNVCYQSYYFYHSTLIIGAFACLSFPIRCSSYPN